VVSRRAQRIGLSPTLRISAQATALRAAGVDVLDFSAGQPDFPTPSGVKEAGRKAIAEDKTRYTPNAGLPELRRAIAVEIERVRGLCYAPEQVLVSSGAKASLYFAFQALIDPGDEVLLPAPYWVSYPDQIRLAEGTPVLVPCSDADGFKLRREALEAAITPRTRGLVLNYPSNPSGACYTREELEPIAEVCLRRELWVVADEIYSRLLYDGRRFTSIAALSPEMRERTIVIDGMSKTYSMTGWRIGYAAGPADIVSAMAREQSHVTSNASTIAQWAAIEALASCEEEVARRVVEFQRRRDEVVRLLRGLDGVSCRMPEGAFYAFPQVAARFGQRAGQVTIDSAQRLAEYLLERARVAVVPGEPFGAPQHLRVSYAVSLERIREGVGRIAEALAALD
jgi:aspartate/methionine/tyrosine aminotransferase